MALPAAQLPTPPPFAAVRPGGLLDAAVGPADMDPHVQTSGAQWWQDVCGSGHLYPAACVAPPYQTRTVDPGGSLTTAYPFVVYASEICPPVGVSNAEAERRVRLKLQISEGQQVERAFWGGGDGAFATGGVLEQMDAAGKVTHLADTTNLVEAVSLLEQQAAVAQYNGPLLIHARPRMGAYVGHRRVSRDNDRPGDPLRTHYGSRYVFGVGYSGNKWDGTGPSVSAETMYVTGRVFLWREPEVFVSPPEQMLVSNGAGSGGTNQRVMYASRAWAIGVECFAAATVVTRGGAVT
jgi:hypothetical protein